MRFLIVLAWWGCFILGTTKMIEIDCCHHFPFLNIISESFPSHIWNSILDIKKKRLKNVWMIQSSINFARRQLFSNCHWSCGTISSLHDSIGSGAVVVYLKRKFIHKYMQCDLSMCSQKAEQCLTLLRLDSIQSLSQLDYYWMVFWDWSAKRGSKQGSTPVTCTMQMLWIWWVCEKMLMRIGWKNLC
jgi:hypothetical protein